MTSTQKWVYLSKFYRYSAKSDCSWESFPTQASSFNRSCEKSGSIVLSYFQGIYSLKVCSSFSCWGITANFFSFSDFTEIKKRPQLSLMQLIIFLGSQITNQVFLRNPLCLSTWLLSGWSQRWAELKYSPANSFVSKIFREPSTLAARPPLRNFLLGFLLTMFAFVFLSSVCLFVFFSHQLWLLQGSGDARWCGHDSSHRTLIIYLWAAPR